MLPDHDRSPTDPDVPSLRIESVRYGDTVAVALTGELDLLSAEELDLTIRDAEETDVARIVVDLAEVSFVDSTGLSILLAAKKRSNGRLSCIPSNHSAVTRLLELTGTTEMLGSD